MGDILFWHAKTKSNIHQPSIKRLLDQSIKKHIFTRTNNTSPFTYEGLGFVDSFQATTPVQINWSFKELNDIDFVSEQEVIYTSKYREGTLQRISINAYERNPEARRICIKHYGYKCLICGFNYFEFYGEYAKDFIQVHHIKPIAEIGEDYEIDPIKNLIPVCAKLPFGNS